MRKQREKYKVRRQRGRNAIRRRWKRTERSNEKWKLKKTGRRVRKTRKVKRITAVNSRTNNARRGGGSVPRKGKLKRWLKKKRCGQKSMRRRYGGGESRKGKRVAGIVRKSTEQRKYRRNARKSSFRGIYTLSNSRRGEQRDPKSRKGYTEHGRGNRERRAEVRRWRAGRVPTRGEGRKRRERGVVCGVGKGKRGMPWRDGKIVLSPGEGRQIGGDQWKRRKGTRKERNYGKFRKRRKGRKWRRSLAWVRNGRSGRGYVLVDYRTGTRRVLRMPRTGEVRRPARRDRSRWMRRG
jgi:hypothetical protein